jgi:hypothetical protein
MTETEIIRAIRRGIREPKAVSVNNTQIGAVILRGVTILGLEIKKADSAFFTKRVSLSSTTHIFSWPTDCETIVRVWDLETTAGDITDATNASPINITCADHGFSTDDIVTNHDVGGNTAANGTFKVTEVDDDNYTLNGSTGNAAYTSGGKCYKVLADDRPKIEKIPLLESTQSSDRKWYPREKNIVVDDPDFTDDIVIDYVAVPDAIADIPASYHEGLVSFGVMQLIRFPDPEKKLLEFQDKKTSLEYHTAIWGSIIRHIGATLMSSTEPYNIPDTMNYNINGGSLP